MQRALVLHIGIASTGIKSVASTSYRGSAWLKSLSYSNSSLDGLKDEKWFRT